MKKLSVVKMYCKQYGKDFVFYMLIIGVFSIISFLYEVEMETVLYASLLCLLLLFVYEMVHLHHFLKKHHKLKTVYQNLPYLSEDFFKADTLCEQDLQKIIVKLQETLSKSLTEWESKEQGAIHFYTTWVHQIKTPISVIKMTLQNEDTKEHRMLSSELFRIEQYVEMVLTYLRLESSSFDYVFQEYDLDYIIKETIHKYAPQFIERKIRLQYESVHTKVLTDEKWLSFIIEQILSNCMKYTFQGSVTITVTPEQVLKITDTGIGIAPEDLPRIFEKGFTGYNGRSDKKATGLGLYLCQETAKKLSHTISAESVVGEGTTISIDLKRRPLGVE